MDVAQHRGVVSYDGMAREQAPKALLKKTVKLVRKLRGCIDQDTRSVTMDHVVQDAVAIQDHCLLTHAIADVLRPWCLLDDPHVYDKRRTSLLRSHLSQHIAAVRLALLSCAAQTHLEPKPTATALGDAVVCWYILMEELSVCITAMRTLWVHGGDSLLHATRKPTRDLLDAVELICEAMPQNKSIVPAKAEKQLDAACTALTNAPLSPVEAVEAQLFQYYKTIEAVAEHIRERRDRRLGSSAALDSDSSDEPMRPVPSAESAMLVGSRMLSRVVLTVVEDVIRFLRQHYDFADNQCWGCYGGAWLEGIILIAGALSESMDRLGYSIVHGSATPDTVAPVRFHCKALLDIMQGHDQFQDTLIESQKDRFKTGIHWAYKMAQRLGHAYEALFV